VKAFTKNLALNRTLIGYGSFIFLIIVTWLTYQPALQYPFVHDDIVFIVQNPDIKNLHIKDILLGQSTFPKDNKLINFYYRPLLEIVYRLEYQWFGFKPSGYHTVNIILHILNGLLLYGLTYRLLGKRITAAFLVSIIFLVHPIQTEAAVSIVGISNLLFAFFCLLSLSLYLFYREAVHFGKRIIYVSGSLLSFLLALLCKEQAIVLPFLILLVEFFHMKERKNQTEVIKYFVVLCLYFLFKKICLGKGAEALFAFNYELYLRVMAIPKTLLTYISLFFVPTSLHYYRSTDVLLPSIPFWILLIVFGYIVYIGIRALHPWHKSITLFGIAWFLITLFPTLNIIPLINEYSLILTSEHFLYLPFAGCLFCLFGFYREYEQSHRHAQKILLVGVGLLSMVLVLLTTRQMTYWRSETSLFERTLAYEKRFGRGEILLARAYYSEGRYDEAIHRYSKALSIFQGYIDHVADGKAKEFYTNFLKDIYFDLANCYQRKNDLSNMVVYYKKLVELDPLVEKAQENLGVYYAQIGEFQKALPYLEKAASLAPDNVLFLRNLAQCYLNVGKREEAAKIFNQIRLIIR
jgi:protein O-mannosyl-transferase